MVFKNLGRMLAVAAGARDRSILAAFCKVVAGAGFEICLACLSKLVMAHDFWCKRLFNSQLAFARNCPRVLARHPESTVVLETFWRRFASSSRRSRLRDFVP
jgi:hypothetical protein